MLQEVDNTLFGHETLISLFAGGYLKKCLIETRNIHKTPFENVIKKLTTCFLKACHYNAQIYDIVSSLHMMYDYLVM